jgi:hypothetical protein
MDRSEKIKYLQESIHKMKRELQEIFMEDESTNSFPLSFNRRRDYHAWLKEINDNKTANDETKLFKENERTYS